MEYIIKKGDTLPALRFELRHGAKVTERDLTDADVDFRIEYENGTTAELNGMVESNDTKVVRHNWVAGETDLVGIHKVVVKMTYQDGNVETFPSAGFSTVRIVPTI